MMSTISPWLVDVNSSTEASLVFIKFSRVTGVLLIEFAIFLPAVAKKLLNSFGIKEGSSSVLPATVILVIFEFLDSEPMASLIRSQVFFGLLLAFWKLVSK